MNRPPAAVPAAGGGRPGQRAGAAI